MAHKPINDTLYLHVVFEFTGLIEKGILLQDSEQFTFCNINTFLPVYTSYFDDKLTDEKEILDEREQ